jgi:16S rRNA A1518/A1519 N6-dimethyltransferase RsmA/KsgA/DIM1 with predicted DNA glycosylase/AP lyase activity
MSKNFAKKSLSQNFLKNPKKQLLVAKNMEFLINKFPNLPIIEIGTGQGDLTQHFLDWDREILGIELDLDCIKILETRFAKFNPEILIDFVSLNKNSASSNLNKELTNSTLDFDSNFDLPKQVKNKESPKKLQFLHLDASKLFASPTDFGILPSEFILLSNLPFHIGSRILMDLPIFYPQVSFSVILQKEVAHKTFLEKDFTFFGAWVGLFWQTKIDMELPPNSFNPKPKVNCNLLTTKSSNLNQFFSQLKAACKLSSSNSNTQNQIDFYLKLKTKFLKDSNFRLKIRNILKALFGNPRKTLANNLKNLEWDKNQIDKFFEFTDFDSKTRLENSNYLLILAQIILYLEINIKNS